MQVEDSWKSTEFVVLPHRDSKDVFILGGVDDIQAVLDDSTVSLRRFLPSIATRLTITLLEPREAVVFLFLFFFLS